MYLSNHDKRRANMNLLCTINRFWLSYSEFLVNCRMTTKYDASWLSSYKTDKNWVVHLLEMSNVWFFSKLTESKSLLLRVNNFPIWKLTESLWIRSKRDFILNSNSDSLRYSWVLWQNLSINTWTLTWSLASQFSPTFSIFIISFAINSSYKLEQ